MPGVPADMTRLSLLLLAATTLSLGCNHWGRSIITTDTRQPAATQPTTAESIDMPTEGVPENASISLRRQGGAGATLYTVMVHADGRVQYDGRNLVDTKGSREGSMNPDTFAELWLALAQTHNDDREAYDACPRMSLDGPTAFTLEVFGGSATALFFGETDAPCADNEAFTRVQSALARLQTEAAVADWVGEENL